MPPILYQKQCPYCLKKFQTFETDKEYCNDECKAHEIYDSRYYDKKNIKQRVANRQKVNKCIECGSQTYDKICSYGCRLKYYSKMSKQKRDAKPKEPPKKRHKLPYEVLNKIAEKKRIMEDNASLYQINRERI